MFEHLDDPSPPELGTGFKSRVVSRGRRLRRRRRAACVGTASVAAAVLGAVGLYGSALRKLDDVDRVEVAGTGAPEIASVRTILIVGSDARDTGELSAPTGRTDTLVVLRVDQQQNIVSALPIPRDLAVTAPPGGPQVRINTIAASNGLSGLVTVIEEEVGIAIDNVVSVDFDGFARLIDLLGGIDIATPAPVRNLPTGLQLAGPGCNRLDGAEALRLVRARHLQTQRDGTWVTDPRGDLGRIDRLQVFLVATLDRLGDARPDPITANQLADWVQDNTVVDATFDRDALVTLAHVALGLDENSVRFNTLPVEAVSLEDSQTAVLTLTSDAEEIISGFNDGTPMSAVPSASDISTCS